MGQGEKKGGDVPAPGGGCTGTHLTPISLASVGVHLPPSAQRRERRVHFVRATRGRRRVLSRHLETQVGATLLVLNWASSQTSEKLV